MPRVDFDPPARTWSAAELRRLTTEQRDALLAEAAARAEQDYLHDRDLTDFEDALRMELYPWGIHVVLIAPAGISTPAVDRMLQDGEAAIQRFAAEGRDRYEQSFRSFLTTAADLDKKGSPPEVVARAVRKALTARTPRARYPVGANATALTWLPWLLPARWLDKVRFRLFGLPRKFGMSADSDPN